MKLLKVDTLVQARERLLKAAKECLPETEQVALADASDRILAEDIVSGEMIPAFRRSSVDGYAVCSKDTAGATESIPVFLKVLEEVEIGHPAVSKIEPGTCAYVPTGGMVPEGADAMVMVEYSERFGTDEVALYENVPYGKCIVLPGEDVKTGDIVLKAGTRIGPARQLVRIIPPGWQSLHWQWQPCSLVWECSCTGNARLRRLEERWHLR